MDPVVNFGKVTVSGTYSDSATEIDLNTGDGAKLPDPSTDGEFNLVWYNSTDYPDPADDPNKEIVRCTARSSDTLTITRAQESTSASTKNTADKTYRMILAFTAKQVSDISTALEEKITSAAVTYENLDSNEDIGTTAGTLCAGNDSRLSDSRTPTSHDNTYHSETYITSSDVTYENLNSNGDVGTTAGTLCAGDDSRLSDSRTPTSHGNEAHDSTFITASDVTYENLNSNSDVGTTAGTLCAGNDSRLSDSRTPTSHGNEAHDSTFITSAGVTYENLNSNGDVGTGSSQVASGDHTHSGYLSTSGGSMYGNIDMEGNSITAVNQVIITGFLNMNENDITCCRGLGLSNGDHTFFLKSHPSYAFGSNSWFLPAGTGTDGQVMMTDGGDANNDVSMSWGSHDDMDGSGTHSHSAIDTHIDDATKHRTINDSGSGTTDLWSADKITSELSSTYNYDTADEFGTVSHVGSIADTDRFIIEDASDSFNKKYAEAQDLTVDTTDSDAVHDNVDAEFIGLTYKSSLTGDELVLIEDYDNSYSKATTKISDIISGYLSDLVDDTSPTLGGDLNCNNNSVTDATCITTYQEYDNGNSGTSKTIDVSNGNYQAITLTDNCTITLTGADCSTLSLRIIKDGTGAETITWSTTVKWAGGTEPTLSTGESTEDIITLQYRGTAGWYGAASTGFTTV